MFDDPRWGDDPRDRDEDPRDRHARSRDRDDDGGPHLGRGPSSRAEQSEADPRDRDDARWAERDRDPRGHDPRHRDPRDVFMRDLNLPRGREYSGREADPRSGDLRHLREQGLISTVRLDGRRDVLEKPSEILRFKAIHRKGREVATVNRARDAACGDQRGRFQDPPYLTTTPFHRFGVNIKVKEETKRDRRVGLQEEQALLD